MHAYSNIQDYFPPPIPRLFFMLITFPANLYENAHFQPYYSVISFVRLPTMQCTRHRFSVRNVAIRCMIHATDVIRHSPCKGEAVISRLIIVYANIGVIVHDYKDQV